MAFLHNIWGLTRLQHNQFFSTSAYSQFFESLLYFQFVCIVLVLRLLFRQQRPTYFVSSIISYIEKMSRRHAIQSVS